MSEPSFEQLFEESQPKPIRTGEVVTGKVIDVKEDEIVLNINYKSDGIITRSEYSNQSNTDLTTVVNVGDEMEAKIIKVNDGDGQVILSYKKLAQDRGNKKLEEAFNNKEVLTGKVIQVLDGGLTVLLEEARIFVPASLVSDSFERDLTKYNGQFIEFVITEFNPKRRRIIGDRKQLLLARKAELQKAVFEKIKEGDVIEGVVKNVTDFGVFIDLGGVDGLLHISEMSWGRVENPKRVFKPGEEVRTFIKKIDGEKIALSAKFPDKNPWANTSGRYTPGKIITGRVARMTDFGAFIELEPGVDALLHVSQISREHVDKPSDVLKVNQVVEAQVVDCNEADRKISLSMKVLQQDAPRRESSADKASRDTQTVVKSESEPASTAMGDALAAAAAAAAKEAEAAAGSGAAAKAVEATVATEAEAAGEAETAAPDAAQDTQEAEAAVAEAKEAEAVSEAVGEALAEEKAVVAEAVAEAAEEAEVKADVVAAAAKVAEETVAEAEEALEDAAEAVDEAKEAVEAAQEKVTEAVEAVDAAEAAEADDKKGEE
jgi:ribosomal protein S1